MSIKKFKLKKNIKYLSSSLIRNSVWIFHKGSVGVLVTDSVRSSVGYSVLISFWVLVRDSVLNSVRNDIQKKLGKKEE
jgi:hypothetical protein